VSSTLMYRVDLGSFLGFLGRSAAQQVLSPFANERETPVSFRAKREPEKIKERFPESQGLNLALAVSGLDSLMCAIFARQRCLKNNNTRTLRNAATSVAKVDVFQKSMMCFKSRCVSKVDVFCRDRRRSGQEGRMGMRRRRKRRRSEALCFRVPSGPGRSMPHSRLFCACLDYCF